jgi:acyl dehydratase
MGAEIGFRFPEKKVHLDPTRIEQYVTALGVAPEPDWECVPGSPVPPGFLMYVTTYGADPVHDEFGIDFRNTVYGGMRCEFHRAVRLGETLRVAPFVSNVATKTTRSKTLTFIEVTCEYFDENGELVAIEASSTIQSSPVNDDRVDQTTQGSAS